MNEWIRKAAITKNASKHDNDDDNYEEQNNDDDNDDDDDGKEGERMGQLSELR